MVSFVTADFFRDQVQRQGNDLIKDIAIRLTTANGLTLPYDYDGYFTTDITPFKQTVNDVIILVFETLTL